jgi:hypothetical protein
MMQDKKEGRFAESGLLVLLQVGQNYIPKLILILKILITVDIAIIIF